MVVHALCPTVAANYRGCQSPWETTPTRNDPLCGKSHPVSHRFSTIDQTIEAIARGEIVIILDAEDRENEGDYICAAEKATSESINLVLSGRGDFCLSVLPETAERLELAPLVEDNNSKLATAFMTPLDHVDCRTGVTADERCLTVKTIADPTEIRRTAPYINGCTPI